MAPASPRVFLVICTLLLCSVGLSASSGQAASSALETPQKSELKPDAPKRTLKLGMPAAEVLALMGKPVEITSMEGQDDKTEIWIYRRLKDSSTEQVRMADKQITQNFTDAMGRVITNVVASEVVMRMRRTETYDVVSVLMVSGNYVNMKRTVEKKESYE